MVRVPEMVCVPEKRDDMYQYFQYSTKYVLEKAVHVPDDLIAYNPAYHYYHLLYRKEREFLVRDSCFLVHALYATANIGT